MYFVILPQKARGQVFQFFQDEVLGLRWRYALSFIILYSCSLVPLTAGCGLAAVPVVAAAGMVTPLTVSPRHYKRHANVTNFIPCTFYLIIVKDDFCKDFLTIADVRILKSKGNVQSDINTLLNTNTNILLCFFDFVCLFILIILNVFHATICMVK